MTTRDASMIRITRGLLHLGDPKIWTASLIPFIVGTSIAYSHGTPLRWNSILLAVVVLVFLEISKNGVNEYFDYESGADRYVTPENRTPFSGGKKVILDGLLTLQEVGIVSIVFLVAALLVAIPLILENRGVLAFGIPGAFLAVAYSIPPFRLSYRGMGEGAVGFVFGPLIVNGAYFLQTNSIHREPILFSIALGFLIMNVLWINEVPDVEADRRAQKWNLVARLGRQRAIPGLILLFALAFFWIALSAFILNRTAYLLALVPALLVPSTVRLARIHILNSKNLMPVNARTILIFLLTGLALMLSAIVSHRI